MTKARFGLLFLVQNKPISMANSDFGIPLTALPFQVIDQPGFVLLKRGLTQIIYRGEMALETILLILTETSGKSASAAKIIHKFPPFRKDDITEILNDLTAKRFLIPTKEQPKIKTPLDVYLWQFGLQAPEIVDKLSKLQITLFGVNNLSFKIFLELNGLGVKNIQWIDEPLLKNTQLFPNNETGYQNLVEEYDIQPISLEKWQQDKPFNTQLVLASSEFGGQALLLGINKFCIDNGIRFVPVYIQEMKGYSGPFTVPGQTACLQCFRSRQNAHLHNIELERLSEDYAKKGLSVAAVHPSMISILAGMTVMELTRLYADLPNNSWGHCIHTGFIHSETGSHKVLKIPRCPVCSDLTHSPATNLDPLKPLIN